MPAATIRPRTAPRGAPRVGRRVLGTVCLLLVAGMLAAGCWPFQPFPRNRVSWLDRQDGLRFDDGGVVLSSANFRSPASPDAACSLEIWLQPGPNHDHEGYILTFYQPRDPQRFKLFQWHDSTLLLYWDDTQSGHREIDVDDVLHPQIPLLITVTSGGHGTSVYLNGVLARTVSYISLSPLDLSGQLVLGTSPVSDFAWSGQVRGLALYGRELTAAQIAPHLGAWSAGADPESASREGAVALYTFSERTGNVVHDRLGKSPDLYIPRSYQIPHKLVLQMPKGKTLWSWNDARDIAINVAGFVPLGFFLYAYLVANPIRRRAALSTVVAGAALSLAIELLQVYLPTRTSSVLDLTTNTLGTCLGVLLCQSGIAQAVLAPHRDDS